MTAYTVLDIDAMERAFGGVFVRARASLGVSAFGLQVIDLPPCSGDFYPEHDHEHDGQEEVYLLLGGTAEMILSDRAIELGVDRFVRVAPEARRRVRSGPEGCRLLVIGGRPAAAYVPPPNSELGGPESFLPGASSALDPGAPPPRLVTQGDY